MMTRPHALLVGAALLCAQFFMGGAAAQSAAACDRACLRGVVDGYLEALTARDPARLPLAAEVEFTENGRVLDLGQGFWKTAGAPLRYRDYVLDPETGGAAVLTGLREYDGIAQLFVRLKIVGRRITEIETIVARIGDQRWFAPENLDRVSGIFGETVPVAQRSARAELTAGKIREIRAVILNLPNGAGTAWTAR